MTLDQTKSLNHIVVSDASGHWDCGAYYKQDWFQLSYIMIKELTPMVAAVGVWGRHWTQSSVLCKCDNQSVASVIISRTSRYKPNHALLILPGSQL